jgi:hypothetical protein
LRASVPVVADADTLFGATTRGFLIYLDYQGLIRLHWSELILDEMSRALVATGRKPDMKSARRHEALMDASLPGAKVPVADVQDQFPSVGPCMRSPKDTHVAACARVLLARGYYPHASVVQLVSKNVRDYGVGKLEQLDIVVSHPDAFLLGLWRKEQVIVAEAFAVFRQSLQSRPTVEQLLQRLAADGQERIAAAMLKTQKSGKLQL